MRKPSLLLQVADIIDSPQLRGGRARRCAPPPTFLLSSGAHSSPARLADGLRTLPAGSFVWTAWPPDLRHRVRRRLTLQVLTSTRAARCEPRRRATPPGFGLQGVQRDDPSQPPRSGEAAGPVLASRTSGMDPRVDVAVVGAGMAGLAAARALSKAGLAVCVLEARDRVGGRVLTIRSPEHGAVELGAEFVHQDPEPTLRLAREAGVALIEIPDVHFEKRGRELTLWEDAFEPMTRVLDELRDDEPDTSAAAFLAQREFDAETRRRFRQLVEGFEAAPLGEVSIKSLVADAGASEESSAQRTVEGGYIELAEYLSERCRALGAKLRLRSPVTGVERRSEGVRIHVDGATLSARACVLTLPVGVLEHEGAERFALPDASKRLQQLGMGHAARVCFVFEDRFRPDALPCE
ncbi:MAG TPA: FAD-dependent oxidoreductase, partial [Polyangiaceae bacterium]|nr:FAD-dependent oxidoreductase [Polyangiaceae bacterium]